MKKVIDLSGVIESSLWGYYSLPGLENLIPPVKIETLATVAKNDFFASKIEMTTISGTYLEAGSHILADGRCLDDYSINDFIKPVKIIKLEKQKPSGLITRQMLIERSPEIKPGDALIIDTSWWLMWNKPGYVLDSPNFSIDALDWFLEKEISILAIDVTCLESAWSDEEDKKTGDTTPELEKGGLLGALFQAGILLAAPVVNLGELTGEKGVLMCMPLNIRGTSGAPARIVFLPD